MLNVIENIMEQMNISSTIASSLTLLILIILSAFLAKISDLVITFIFKRAVNKTKTTFDNDLIEALHKPIYYSVFFTRSHLAFILFLYSGSSLNILDLDEHS